MTRQNLTNMTSIYSLFETSKLQDVIVAGYTDSASYQQPRRYFTFMYNAVYLEFHNVFLELKNHQYKSRLSVNLVDIICQHFEIDEPDEFCASSIDTLLGMAYSRGEDRIISFKGFFDSEESSFFAILLETEYGHKIFIDPNHIFGLFITSDKFFIEQWHSDSLNNLGDYEIISWNTSESPSK